MHVVHFCVCWTGRKTGRCPQLPVDDGCHVQCTSDGHCLGQQKCCRSGCSRTCVDPGKKKTITPGHLGMFGMALVGVTCTAEVYISAFEQCDYCTGCIHRVEVKSSVWCLSVCPFHDPCASVQEVVTLSCYWCPDVASLHFEPFIRGLIYLLVKVVHLKSEAGGQAVYTHTHTPI